MGGLPGLAGLGGFGGGGTVFGDVLGTNVAPGGTTGCPPAGCPLVATATSSQALARASDFTPSSTSFQEESAIAPAGTTDGGTTGAGSGGASDGSGTPPLSTLTDDSWLYPPCEPEPTHPVPLPPTWLLLLAGAAAIAGTGWRRRNR